MDETSLSPVILARRKRKRAMLDFIVEHTKDASVVVDFGCMHGGRLKVVEAPRKIGIEVWLPYLINADPDVEFEKVHGDMIDFEQLLDDNAFDTAMFIDTIEHLEKEIGYDLLKRVQDRFKKILVITPSGFRKQDKDVTGFGADEYQVHRSGWSSNDLIDLDFKVIIHRNFHSDDGTGNVDCIFAVWENDA